MNWLDVVFVFILLLSILSGLKKGMLLQLLDLFGFIVSWILALKLGPVVGESLDGIFNISAFLQSLDIEFLSFLHLEEYAVTLIGVFTVLTLSGIVLLFLGRVLRLFSSLPLIKQFNSLFGAAFGAVKGILFILFIIILLNFVPHPSILEAKETSLGFSTFEKYAFVIIDLGIEALTNKKV